MEIIEKLEYDGTVLKLLYETTPWYPAKEGDLKYL